MNVIKVLSGKYQNEFLVWQSFFGSLKTHFLLRSHWCGLCVALHTERWRSHACLHEMTSAEMFPKIICPMSLCLLSKLWHWLNKQVMTWRSRVLRERPKRVCVCVWEEANDGVCVCVCVKAWAHLVVAWIGTCFLHSYHPVICLVSSCPASASRRDRKLQTEGAGAIWPPHLRLYPPRSAVGASVFAAACKHWAVLSEETFISGIIVLNVYTFLIPHFISVVLGSEYFADVFFY